MENCGVSGGKMCSLDAVEDLLTMRTVRVTSVPGVKPWKCTSGGSEAQMALRLSAENTSKCKQDEQEYTLPIISGEEEGEEGGRGWRGR